MKANHIPQKVRLKNKIRKLERKLIEFEPKPYGGSNPYYCGSCELSLIECSIRGHLKGCKVVSIQKEIEHYKSILNKLKEDL